jgi:hypothetical protein
VVNRSLVRREMLAARKTVRVFISSTFGDMHAERDYLARGVFSELQASCAKRHAYLVDVGQARRAAAMALL